MVASVPTVIVAEDQPLLRLGLVQSLKNSGSAVRYQARQCRAGLDWSEYRQISDQR
jgi:hypothetical protein